jgi:hypothetical protein
MSQPTRWKKAARPNAQRAHHEHQASGHKPELRRKRATPRHATAAATTTRPQAELEPVQSQNTSVSIPVLQHDWV